MLVLLNIFILGVLTMAGTAGTFTGSIFNNAAQNTAGPQQTYEQVLAQTNPNGISFGGSGAGLTGLTQPSGVDGLTVQAGGGYSGAPQFGSSGQVLGDSTSIPSADPQAAAQTLQRQNNIAGYSDQLNGLNSLLADETGNQQRGEQGINQGFDRGNAQLNDNYQGQQNRYQTQENDATTGYQNNLNTIQGQARNGYQSLQALLGGSGSAGELLAPLAVSNVAGQQTSGANQAFGKNLENLATARTDAGKQYKQAQNDLLDQKNSKLSALINSIDQQKINYQNQIGQAQNQLRIAQGGSYQTPTAQNDLIAQLRAEQNGLGDRFAQSAFTPQNQNYQSPDLQKFTAQAAQVGGLSNQPVNSGDPAAAFQALLASQAKKTSQQL